MWPEKQANGKIKYVERYKDPLTETYKKVSTTLTSDSSRAQKKARRILDEKIKEKIAAFETNIQKKTFEEVAKEWLKDYKRTAKGSTFSVRSYQLDKVLNDYLGNGRSLIISNLKEEHIQEVLDDLVFNEKLSREYINSLFSVISMVFKYAKKKKYVSTLDPVKHASVPRLPSTVEELEAGQVPRYLEKEELDYVLNYFYEVRPEYAEIFDVQAYTGMRVSEVLSLTKDDVTPGHIAIRTTLDNYQRSPTKGQRTVPKSRRSFRSIEINNRTEEVLNRRMKLNELLPENKKGFLFTTEKGTPHKLGTITNFMNRHSKKLDLGMNLTTHVFRHTHVSQLAAQGVPLHVIMNRVGHEDEGTIKKIYLHVTKQSKDNLISILNNL